MKEEFHFKKPEDAGWFLRHLRDAGIYYNDSGILENLFSPERIRECDEAVFLQNDETVLALAIIATRKPAMWSYYTIPEHRGKGCGYRLLMRCIERIVECIPDSTQRIYIEPISDGSSKHIKQLPHCLLSRLLIRDNR